MPDQEESPLVRGGQSRLAGRGLPLAVVALVFATICMLLFAIRERDRVRELSLSRDEMKAAVAQTRAQLDDLTRKLNNSIAAARPEPAVPPVVEPAPRIHKTSIAVPRVSQTPRVDPRVKRLQDQVAEQQRQLAGTQEDLKKAREEMDSKLDFTKTELNGSIARNHDELVELQKRNERNYYEFQIAKSKQFQRTGPLSLSLRKADSKHKRFDMVMLIDDAQLEKKRVNLFEPVMVRLADRPQPVEIVVNRISKDAITGYVSEPKYRTGNRVENAAAQPAPALTAR